MTPPGAGPPAVAVFDVNETLSDLSGLGARLEDLGAGPGVLPRWFAATLRDGFALTAAGAQANFATIGISNLASLLEPISALTAAPPAGRRAGRRRDGKTGPASRRGPGAAGSPGCRGANRHPEQRGCTGRRVPAETGRTARPRRTVTLGRRAGRWKPAGEAYAYAARQCGVEPGELALIAVHPWDIDGAARPGLRT